MIAVSDNLQPLVDVLEQLTGYTCQMARYSDYAFHPPCWVPRTKQFFIPPKLYRAHDVYVHELAHFAVASPMERAAFNLKLDPQHGSKFLAPHIESLASEEDLADFLRPDDRNILEAELASARLMEILYAHLGIQYQHGHADLGTYGFFTSFVYLDTPRWTLKQFINHPRRRNIPSGFLSKIRIAMEQWYNYQKTNRRINHEVSL